MCAALAPLLPARPDVRARATSCPRPMPPRGACPFRDARKNCSLSAQTSRVCRLRSSVAEHISSTRHAASLPRYCGGPNQGARLPAAPSPPLGIDGAAGSLAPWFGPPQYLGSDAACRVLEICSATEDRRRQTRLVCAEREQFFLASRKGQAPRGGMGRGQEVARARTSGLAGSSGASAAHIAWSKIHAAVLRHGVPRHLSRRPNPPAPAVNGALIKLSVFAMF